MTDIDLMERKARRTLGWGTAAMLVLALITAVVSTAVQISFGTITEAAQRPTWVISALLALMTLIAFGTMVYGMIQLGRVGRRRKHAH